MSLINDALKRAAETKPPTPAAPGQDLQLQPVSSAKTRPWYVGWLPVAVVLTLVVAGLFLVRAWNRTERLFDRAGTPKNPIPIAAREATQPVADSSQSPAGTAPPAIPSPGDSGQALTSSAATPVASQPAPQVPAPPSFPALQLQGIYFRPANPSVVINLKTLYTGDYIDEARIVEITRTGAKVQWREETRVLTFK